MQTENNKLESRRCIEVHEENYGNIFNSLKLLVNESVLVSPLFNEFKYFFFIILWIFIENWLFIYLYACFISI